MARCLALEGRVPTALEEINPNLMITRFQSFGQQVIAASASSR